MPKNKKPAGGRPAKNFEPRYGKSSSSSQRAGSRSPGHRGYRSEADAPAKRRWTADDRAARVERGTERGADRTSADRTNTDRGRYSRDDRAASNGDFRGTRGERTESRSFGRDDRARRDFSRGERSDSRPFSRDDRAPRRDFDNDRPRRSFDNDRPRRDFDNDRPRRDFGDRAPRRDSDDRAPRRDFGDRAPRRDFDNDRPRHTFDNDRAPRRDFDSDRPRRSFDNDRPRRNFDNDRPRRSFDNDRPRRSFDNDRPRRDFDNDRGQRDSSFYPKRDHDRAAGPVVDDVVLERLEAEAITAEEVDGVTFGDLGLGGNIVRALADLGAASPFPIQAATIPDVLSGKDVLGRGRTGSGKTIAFGAPLVERLMHLWADQGKSGGKRQMGRTPRALIMAPTRELALQIDRTVQPIARSVGLFTTQIYGGVPQGRQVGALQRGVDIVIGTPGRIEDLIEQRKLDLSQVEITVLDEADHMCDLGFLEPVQRILRRTSEGGQKLLFSATLDKGVAALVDEFLESPAVHEVAGEDQASGTIDHRVLVIDHREKLQIIEELTRRDGKTLVFARTRAYAEQLAEELEDLDIPAVSLHGDLNQSRRTRNLEKLTKGRVDVLVATDVAARGIHIDDIDLVIQADAPDEYKTYLHRSGRTGRAGRTGTVVTLISRNRRRRVSDLLKRAEIEAQFTEVAAGSSVLADLAGE